MAIRGISNLTSKVKMVVSQTAKKYVPKSKATGTTVNKVLSKTVSTASVKKSSTTSSKTSTSSVKTSNKMITANGKVTSKTNTQSTKTGSKTSTQSAKTSSTTSQESEQILKKPITYVTGAAAIYTSSGSVSAYACGVTTKQSKKDLSESCMSCNRPSASYPEQSPQSKSLKADKSQKATDSKVSKLVSPAVPKKKADTKKASTTKKKSAPIKEYMPSDSRNGAGKAFYRKKTTPSGAKEGASFLISLVPGVGDAKDIQEAITGKDWVTGKKLSKTDRLTTAASAGIPIISGSSVRVARNGIKYGNKVTKKTVKKAVWKGSSKSEKSTKVVKKALGKGTKKSDDVREKAVGKLKKGTKKIEKTDTGKKAVKESENLVKIKESGIKKKGEAAGKVHKDGVVSKSGSTATINPNEIRYSQSSVNGSSDIIQSMKINGWQGEPIDVVEMPDGIYTTIDNTRVISAREAGINVEANVHGYNDPLPSEYIERFTTKKGVPKTWGEAIELRVGKQKASFRNGNPYGQLKMETIK